MLNSLADPVDPCGSPQVYMYVYVSYVREPIENTYSSSLQAGPGATEPQQPPLCWVSRHDKP